MWMKKLGWVPVFSFLIQFTYKYLFSQRRRKFCNLQGRKSFKSSWLTVSTLNVAYTAISRKVVGKVHATIPKGIVGSFEFSVFQRNLKELARKAMEMCLRMLKESNKSRFDSYSRQEQSIDNIPCYLSGLSRAHFFSTTFLEIAVCWNGFHSQETQKYRKYTNIYKTRRNTSATKFKLYVPRKRG